jgi:CRP-like cAMP-binding protein
MIIDFENRLFMKPFFNYLEKLHPLSNELMAYYGTNCQLIAIKKYKHILSPIDSNNAMYFINKGVVRGFIKDKKKDISTWFGFENQIIEAIRHPDQQSAHSVEYLQAIEDCELIRIPYTITDFLYSYYPESHVIARKILEIQYYQAAERSIIARIPNALARYLKLESTAFDIDRIPQRFLASYLGMRLETLSRIRNRAIDQDIKMLA